MNKLRILITAIALTFTTTTAAPTGVGAIVPRDTDKVSELRYKLQRLQKLLSQLDLDDEENLKSLAVQSSSDHPVTNQSEADRQVDDHLPKPDEPVASEDMGPEVNKFKDVTETATRKTLITKDTIPTPGPAFKYDDPSIQILAKALARLKQPKYEMEDKTGGKTGDYLGTEYNESGEDSQKTEDMEQLITRALLRLKLDKSVSPSGRPALKTDIHGLVRTETAEEIASLKPTMQQTRNDLFRKEAIKTVEDRLVQDVALINKLGISVEEVMQDLKEKLKREQKLSDIENELDSLAQQRQDY